MRWRLEMCNVIQCVMQYYSNNRGMYVDWDLGQIIEVLGKERDWRACLASEGSYS